MEVRKRKMVVYLCSNVFTHEISRIFKGHFQLLVSLSDFVVVSLFSRFLSREIQLGVFGTCGKENKC